MKPQSGLLLYLKKKLLASSQVESTEPPERQRALDLIAAIDAGGIPLNPARVNDIARCMGLEVSRSAPVEATIERLRAVLANQRP
ncbi:hypothetical protein ACVBEH_16520 [Roseateles sp. GG27B]